MTKLSNPVPPALVAIVAGMLDVAAQSPPARYSHVVAHDAATAATFAFGGDSTVAVGSGTGYVLLQDTWRLATSAWQPGPAGLPPEVAAGCYDSIRARTVALAASLNGHQLWELDGVSWTQRTVPMPSARVLPAMAFDAARAESILFGGWGPGEINLNDTWAWNGTFWMQKSTAIAPPPRRHHSMAYDRLRQRIVLFGGWSDSSGSLDDTWEWNGTIWTQVLPLASPPSRWGHGLAWDHNRGKVIAFGGTSQQFPTNAVRNDTWQYDGSTWTQVQSPISPPGRMLVAHSLDYDASRQSVVLFGGLMGNIPPQEISMNDTWELTAIGWRPVLSFVQSPINGRSYARTPPMTWPQAEALAVSYGGHLATVRNSAEHSWLFSEFGNSCWIGLSDAATEGVYVWSSGETLTYTNWLPGQPDNLNDEDYVHFCECSPTGAWNDLCPSTCMSQPGIVELSGPSAPFTATSFSAAASPPPLTTTALAPLSTGGAILFGGQTSFGPQFGTYELQGAAWTKRFSLLNPMVRTGHTLSLDGAREEVLLFGGKNPLGVALNDTWAWANGQWTYLQLANAPSPRSGHRLAYAPDTQTVELFGGADAMGIDLGDHWQWNGTIWAQRTPSALPPARREHGLAFDSRRNRLVLHGGATGATVRDDVWEWNGTTWTQVLPQGPSGLGWVPSARAGHTFTFDPRAERVLLHGGADTAGNCTADAWTWDGSAWTRLSTTGSVPSARRNSQAYFDTAANELRLFAGACGTDLANDLWRLDLPVFASSETYGQGCIGTLGVPTMDIEAPSRPLVGTTLNLRFTGVPGQFIPAIGAYSGQRDTYFGIPLPLDLTVVGLPGCTLLTSAEETHVLPAPNGTGSVLWAVPIPNDPRLLGTNSFFQGLSFELPGYPRWASLSNAVAVRIGNQ